MSTVCYTTVSFQPIFDAASREYKKKTGQDLQIHPLAAELQQCNSPDGVLNMFQKQADALDNTEQRDQTFIKWLNPTVHLLYTLSATIGGGVGVVSFAQSLIALSQSMNIRHTGVLPCKCNIYWNRHPSRGNYSPMIPHITFF